MAPEDTAVTFREHSESRELVKREELAEVCGRKEDISNDKNESSEIVVLSLWKNDNYRITVNLIIAICTTWILHKITLKRLYREQI